MGDGPQNLLGRLDALMESSPWYPRVLPFAVYIVALPLIGIAADAALWAYPVGYAIQCGLVLWLLWRYRRLTPELNLKFHWLALPTGVALVFAWVELGYLSIWLSGGTLGPERVATGEAAPTMLEEMRAALPAVFAISMGLRLFGMSVVVSLFEELFTRSLLLRAFHRWRPSKVGLLQFLADLPVVGEQVERTEAGRAAMNAPPMFTKQLIETPVGAITAFSVAVSTLVFMLNHMPRDYLGCVACGVVWCWLVWYTNRSKAWRDRPLGLGPIIWSHGITNAGLWAWTLYTGDWQFL
jgi:membrane protease YdiL (CAAX protease family)